MMSEKRVKRRIIVDDCEKGLIPIETMKLQFRDTSDITGPMEYAPPTKKLMQLKENRDLEKLFSRPGRSGLSPTASKSFSRNLITKAVDEGVEPDSNNLDQEVFNSNLEEQGTFLVEVRIKEECLDDQLEFSSLADSQSSNSPIQTSTDIQIEQGTNIQNSTDIQIEQGTNIQTCTELQGEQVVNIQTSTDIQWEQGTNIQTITDLHGTMMNIQTDQFKTEPVLCELTTSVPP
ncbi:uncharacterized protein LOC134263528 [Saccostrea cucullata]|uniref:uncharacterized protein LOC134263528 n=1 Tax=Saccostrea cuccullata TaxID=36930 RepID=UPI002ED6A153